jgi:ABC-type uncharacterized transport system involved in gliding motility auxiliary subunit
MIQLNVINAVAKRNFKGYFSGVLGYLFIVVFCVGSAYFTFAPQFFAANQANLDQLSGDFWKLLLFLIPAITMTVWADERKLGTDELLFTLPARELDVVLGKFLAVVGVYSVSLLFSLVNVLLLDQLGNPDPGLIFASYFGYWIAGCALLSAGMLASALTSSPTVAFVLGVILCGIPISLDRIPDVLELGCSLVGFESNFYTLRDVLVGLSLSEQMRDFSLGVISLSSIAYFAGFTGMMLYLNLVVISERHWAGSKKLTMSLHFAVRTVCLFVVFVSVLYMVLQFPRRADLTAEHRFTLSDASYDTLNSLGEGQQITIQAFISPDVPRDYSSTRRQLIGLLREFDQRAGSAIDVRIVDVVPFSEEAEEARVQGITPIRIQYEDNDRLEETDVFLGAVVSRAGDTVVIPFFGKGLPIEYELTRSVRTVAQEKRLTVGVLQTDANVIGDSGGGGPASRSWEIVTELRKQYDVIAVNPSRRILVDAESDTTDGATEDFDVLLAIMPSALTQPQMDNLLEYVQAGRPTLIFDDPCPYFSQGQFGLTMAPKLPKPSPGGGGMMGRQSQPEQKADNGEATSLMNLLDVRWDNGTVVYDQFNPHNQFGRLPPEFVFVSRAGNSKAFSDSDPVSNELHDVVCLFTGTLQQRDRREGQKFEPLLQTSGQSGLLEWDDYTLMSFSPFTMSQSASVKPVSRRTDDAFSHVIAAHITNDSKSTPLNVIFCADIDLLSDWFFMERNRGNLDIAFDNVTFVLNAVDVLSGEETFISLRSRRSGLRTLEYVENQTRDMRAKLSQDEEAAEKSMDESLDKARDELRAKIEELQKRTDLDSRSKDVLLKQLEEDLNRKLAIKEDTLERQKNDKIRKAALEMRREIRQVETQVQIWSWVMPAILPICFGLLFLGIRQMGESQSVDPNRLR